MSLCHVFMSTSNINYLVIYNAKTLFKSIKKWHPLFLIVFLKKLCITHLIIALNGFPQNKLPLLGSGAQRAHKDPLQELEQGVHWPQSSSINVFKLEFWVTSNPHHSSSCRDIEESFGPPVLWFIPIYRTFCVEGLWEYLTKIPVQQ